MAIGTTAALIGSSVVGGLAQASAAKKAASAQTKAAEQDIAFQRETRDIIRNDLSPYRTGGYTAQQALDFELGLGSRPMIGGTMPQIEEFTVAGQSNGAGGRGGAGATRFRVNGQEFATRAEAEAFAAKNLTGGTAYGGFTKTPGYDFRLQQGQNSLAATAAARGGLYSGAAMRDALQYGQDYASSEYGNYLNRLAGRADTGMSAAGMSGQASQVAAGNVSNALGNIGNARAAGAIGVGNAITGGIQNAIGAWQYMKNLGGTTGGYGGGR